MKKVTKIAIIGAVAIILGAVAAQAETRILRDNNAINAPTQQGVNGRNAIEIQFDKGRFVRTQNGQWSELNSSGQAVFNFVEQNRDDWSVYLRDNSRGVKLQLDLHRKMVVYSDDTGQKFDLYGITRSWAAQVQTPAPKKALSRRSIKYTCKNDIPLILTFESNGLQSWVTWNYDGNQGNKLSFVEKDQRGITKYTTERNTIQIFDTRAYLNTPKIKTGCNQK